MTLELPSPTVPGARAQVLLGYLDFYRGVILHKLDGLSEQQLTSSTVPSGWTPLGLLKHLVCTEERWLVYRYENADLANAFADLGDAGWGVEDGETYELLTEAWARQAVRTRALVEGTELDQPGPPSDRWRGGEPAALERLLWHLIQELARHAGHLDVVRERIDGTIGEDEKPTDPSRTTDWPVGVVPKPWPP